MRGPFFLSNKNVQCVRRSTKREAKSLGLKSIIRGRREKNGFPLRSYILAEVTSFTKTLSHNVV
jgi:hypothetical protein